MTLEKTFEKQADAMKAAEENMMANFTAKMVDEIERIMANSEKPEDLKHKVWSKFIQFTDAEIDKMPKWFAVDFALNHGSTARVDKYVKDDTDGETAHYEYTVFYRVNGETVSGTDSDLSRAKRKFIFALHLLGKRFGLAG